MTNQSVEDGHSQPSEDTFLCIAANAWPLVCTMSGVVLALTWWVIAVSPEVGSITRAQIATGQGAETFQASCWQHVEVENKLDRHRGVDAQLLLATRDASSWQFVC